ncbi:hypothetical protein NMG60_11000730 [Bertholletia excelsa]
MCQHKKLHVLPLKAPDLNLSVTSIYCFCMANRFSPFLSGNAVCLETDADSEAYIDHTEEYRSAIEDFHAAVSNLLGVDREMLYWRIISMFLPVSWISDCAKRVGN